MKAILSAAVLALGLGGTAWAAEPVVVELYTSQGCNSCPPADKVLTTMSERPDILALAFHVDYWDYIGWKDTLGRADNTSRQRAYARAMGGAYVYTPQMIVNGRWQGVGSDPGAIERLITQAKTQPRLTLTTQDAGKEKFLVLPADKTRADRPAATVWWVTYAPTQTVAIPRGENAGHTYTYHNAVTDMRALGHWQGQASTLQLPAAAGPQAVLVQEGEVGPILGALALPARSAF